jgi:hypothetical protein
MSRLSILTHDEVKLFDQPPRFSFQQRQKYFQLSDKLMPLLKNLRTATHKVGMVLQWSYFRASGRFFSLDHFHSADVRYVTELLDISYSHVDLAVYQQKRKTYREHQQVILKAMNFRVFDTDAKQWLQMQLENLVAKHMQRREIIYYLASQCHQQKIEIPCYHLNNSFQSF